MDVLLCVLEEINGRLCTLKREGMVSDGDGVDGAKAISAEMGCELRREITGDGELLLIGSGSSGEVCLVDLLLLEIRNSGGGGDVVFNGEVESDAGGAVDGIAITICGMELNATESLIEVGEVSSVGIGVIDAIGEGEGVMAVGLDEK